MRAMGIDWGEARVGIAVSDPLGISAQPVEAVTNDKDLFNNINGLIKKFDVGEVVIGLPKRMDGKLGPAAEKVMAFHEKAKSELTVPVTLLDERLTTRIAERSLASIGVSTRRMKKLNDASSAAILLQGYMDSRKR